MSDLNAVRLKIKLEALISRREAMLIANRQRDYPGEAPVYTEDHFLVIESEMNELYNYS